MSDTTPTTTDGAAPVKPPSRLERLRAELQRTKTKATAVESAMSEEDLEEIELRRKLADAQAELDQRELEQRELDLDRRYEAAKERWPDAQLNTLSIEGYPDTFVLKHSQAAFGRWEKETAKSERNKRVDRSDINRHYATALVVDWNGQDLSDPTAEGGHELVAYLKERTGIVTAITIEGTKLAGAYGKARKS